MTTMLVPRTNVNQALGVPMKKLNVRIMMIVLLMGVVKYLDVTIMLLTVMIMMPVRMILVKLLLDVNT
jgi:hypothetical protein